MGRKIAAVILAGGQGSRLGPYTNLTQKSLFTIGGISLLTYHIDRFRRMGIEERNICVVIGHLLGEVAGFVERYHPGITCVEQEKERYGTAIGALAAKDFVGEKDSIIIFGDIYSEDSFSVWPRYEGPLIGAVRVEDVSKFGRIISDDSNYLLDIEEKTGAKTSGDVFAGVIKEPHEFFDILSRLPETYGEYRITDAIILQNKSTPHKIHRLNGHWSDIGDEKALKEAREIYCSSHSK